MQPATQHGDKDSGLPGSRLEGRLCLGRYRGPFHSVPTTWPWRLLSCAGWLPLLHLQAPVPDRARPQRAPRTPRPAVTVTIRQGLGYWPRALHLHPRLKAPTSTPLGTRASTLAPSPGLLLLSKYTFPSSQAHAGCSPCLHVPSPTSPGSYPPPTHTHTHTPRTHSALRANTTLSREPSLTATPLPRCPSSLLATLRT